MDSLHRQEETPRASTGPLPVIVAALLALALAGLAGLAIELGDAHDVKANHLLRDAATVYDMPWYAGAISFFGVALLLVTAAIACFSAALSERHCGLLLMVGGLSVVLALDDQFLLHERVLPRLTGLPEPLFVAPYAVPAIAIGAAVWRAFGLRAVLSLAIPLGLLALSAGADFFPGQERASYAVEDLSKLAGFAGWAGFWISCCSSTLRRHAPAAGAPEAQRNG